MMFCHDCGRIFTEEEAMLERVEADGEEGTVELCPYCASYNVSGANEDRF